MNPSPPRTATRASASARGRRHSEEQAARARAPGPEPRVSRSTRRWTRAIPAGAAPGRRSAVRRTRSPAPADRRGCGTSPRARRPGRARRRTAPRSRRARTRSAGSLTTSGGPARRRRACAPAARSTTSRAPGRYSRSPWKWWNRSGSPSTVIPSGRPLQPEAAGAPRAEARAGATQDADAREARGPRVEVELVAVAAVLDAARSTSRCTAPATTGASPGPARRGGTETNWTL